jgi:outer membrane murein-binding lipoprotein Lpp
MLLNEFLKEHRKVEKLEAVLTRLESTVEKQAAEIEKVSAQIQASQATPRVDENR